MSASLCVLDTCTHASKQNRTLTGVETMYGLLDRAALMVWKRSTSPSALTLSTSHIAVMNTPVLAMPSLKTEEVKMKSKHNHMIKYACTYAGGVTL